MLTNQKPVSQDQEAAKGDGARQQSAFAPPTILLTKGGAIRGMDEKSAASPGRPGLRPRLSLASNLGAGNRLF
jgi:hypothetical protein